ncbi:MAG: hypothetical protein M3438_01680 [Pseudomonadota bacterium]|nr:hypothetical protein [Sphingomonas sp.]MDQ3477862.1 hypothetical protein [Pseudomonadota bacterium]
MILFVSLLPALVGLSAVEQAPFPQARTTFNQDEFVTRVPVQLRSKASRFVWTEVRGPRCIASHYIRGALLSGRNHVDFVMSSERRFRATFGNACPALDFYDGFYVNSPNRLICAGRDEIRSRMGGSCSIESFRQLVPLRRVAIP